MRHRLFTITLAAFLAAGVLSFVNAQDATLTPEEIASTLATHEARISALETRVAGGAVATPLVATPIAATPVTGEQLGAPTPPSNLVLAEGALTLGQTFAIGDLEITATGIQEAEILDYGYRRDVPRGKFLIVELTVKVTGRIPQMLDYEQFRLYSANTDQFTNVSDVTSSYLSATYNVSSYEELQPGLVYSTAVIFDVPPESGNYWLLYGGAADNATVGIALTPATEPGTAPAPTFPGTPSATSVSYRLEGGDIYFNPTELTVTAGDVIELVNVGVLPHNFVVEGYNDGAPVDMPVGGDVVQWTVPADLSAGEYTFYCAVPGHRPAGMWGTITVTS